METKNPTNMNELRNTMITDMQKFRAGDLSVDQLKASANFYGKVIASVKQEVDDRRRINEREGLVPFNIY